MSEIRGEKLRFRKRDIVPLHALPSAQAEDPLIVHCPPPKRSLFRRFLRVLAGFAGLWLVVFFAVYAVVESGTLDAALAQRAQAVLNNALGGGLRLELLHTATSPAAAMASWLAEREAPRGFAQLTPAW